MFGAEFVGPKQAGVEFVCWCRVGAEFARCRVCEVPSLLVPSLQGAEVSGTHFSPFAKLRVRLLFKLSVTVM